MLSSLKGMFQDTEWKTMLMAVASLVLSAASFYTTYFGMIEFMGIAAVALAITFAVQALLFVISWWLARYWFLGLGRLTLGTGVFLVCASISVFFSFASLFSFIDDNRTRNATVKRATTEVASVLNELECLLNRRLSEAHVSLVGAGANAGSSTASACTEAERQQAGGANADAGAGNPGYQKWRTDLLDYLNAAKGAPDAYKKALKAQRDKLASDKAGLEANIAALENQANSLRTGQQNSTARLQRIDASITAAERELEQLRQQEVSLRQQQAQAKTDMDREGVTGQGPKWRAAKTRFDEFEAQIQGIPAQEKTLSERLITLRADRVQAQAQVGQSPANQLKQIEARIATARIDLADLENQLATNEAETQGDVTVRIDKIKDDLQLFEATRNYEAYDDVIAACNRLQEDLEPIAADANLPTSFRCDNQSISSTVKALARQAEAVQDYRQGCVGAAVFADANAGDVTAEVGSAEQRAQITRQFNTIIKTGETCIAKSRLPQSDTKPYSDKLFDFSNTGGVDAHNFALAQAALLRDKSPLAFMAVMIAIAIDSLVLLCAIIGTSTMKPVDQDVMTFLGLPSQPYIRTDEDGPAERTDGMITRPENRREAAAFDRVVKWLVPHDHAYWNTDPDRDGPTIVLNYGARRELQDIISAGKSRSGGGRGGGRGQGHAGPRPEADIHPIGRGGQRVRVIRR